MDKLEFYVIEAVESAGEVGEVATVPGADANLHSMKAIRRFFAPVARKIEAQTLLDSFEQTRIVVEQMLTKLDAMKNRGYLLDKFEIKLALSGEGTIGIVTASAEAGVVLKFRRRVDTDGDLPPEN